MAEKSLFWYTDGFNGDIGDGAAPYTQEEFRLFNHSAIAHNQENVGVFVNTLNKLAVSGAASPLALATGRALVYGFPYWNDASLNLTVTTPSVGDTGGRVVLRAVWSTQTVRAVVILSNDGVAALPAMTQNAGAQWEIPIASFVIDTSGDIWTDATTTTPGVTDEREFIGPWVDTTTIEIASDPGYIRVPAEGIDTNELADDSVTGDKAGDRLPQFHRRQGGSSSNWGTTGTNNYTPGAVRMQAGSISVPSVGDGNVSQETVTFPVAFGETPLIFVSVLETTLVGISPCFSAASTTQVNVGFGNNSGFASGNITVNWLAIGEE